MTHSEYILAPQQELKPRFYISIWLGTETRHAIIRRCKADPEKNNWFLLVTGARANT